MPDLRKCARDDCDRMVPRKPREIPSDYSRRTHCSPACREKTMLEGASGDDKTGPRMSTRRAEAWLSTPPVRLRVQIDQLPPAERQRALQGWGCA